MAITRQEFSDFIKIFYDSQKELRESFQSRTEKIFELMKENNDNVTKRLDILCEVNATTDKRLTVLDETMEAMTERFRHIENYQRTCPIDELSVRMASLEESFNRHRQNCVSGKESCRIEKYGIEERVRGLENESSHTRGKSETRHNIEKIIISFITAILTGLIVFYVTNSGS